MWPGLTGLRTKLPWQMIVAILSVGVVSAAGSRNRPLYPLGWVLGRTLRSAPRASYTAPPPNSDLTSTRCDSFSQSRRALTQLLLLLLLLLLLKCSGRTPTHSTNTRRPYSSAADPVSVAVHMRKHGDAVLTSESAAGPLLCNFSCGPKSFIKV